jgi:hypothetical protein
VISGMLFFYPEKGIVTFGIPYRDFRDKSTKTLDFRIVTSGTPYHGFRNAKNASIVTSGTLKRTYRDFRNAIS